MKCPICLESFNSEKQTISTECGHLIHNDCIQKWLDTGNLNCPKCRSKISDRNKLVRLYLSSSDEMSESQDSLKRKRKKKKSMAPKPTTQAMYELLCYMIRCLG